MIDITHDGKLPVAVAPSARRRKWKNGDTTWAKLLDRFANPQRTHETYKQYLNMTREEQGSIKDVGGFVGGYLKEGLRRTANVEKRSLITLDVDFACTCFWEDFIMVFDSAGAIHTTHKHSEETPRYRLIMPLSRTVTPEEYVAVARKIASKMGIDLFDPTTFETARLMYWPSVAKDGLYDFQYQDGPWIDPDKVLAEYHDWRDISEWAFASSVKEERTNPTGKKQKDPTGKEGFIGAFCKAYDVHGAIEAFLDDVYEPGTEGRYTYIGGTTANGLVVYEDGAFAFSHHGSDPAGNQLLNSFDLVRLHKFGGLDNDYQGNGQPPSVKAMIEMCKEDDGVKSVIVKEKMRDVREEFESYADGEVEIPTEEDQAWMEELELDNAKNFKATAFNLSLIFTNDKNLKDKFAYNEFDYSRYLTKSVPWRKFEGSSQMKDVDYAGVRGYVETVYGITTPGKLEDALLMEFEKNSFHPVREYLDGVKWDEEPRLDSLLVDFYGAADTVFVREATRKLLTGAVARVFEPGCKFDYMLVLVGKQGTGKSSFWDKMGRGWFSDSFIAVEGTRSFEQIQGSWILESAELSGLRKAEVESIKHYITKQTDKYRPPYMRVVESFPRQNVFVGTTNDRSFLKDDTGNRRFWPIDINMAKRTKNHLKGVAANGMPNHLTDEYVDQVWAEAYYRYAMGEQLFLSKEAEDGARAEQEKFYDQDDRAGMVQAYLDTPLPKNWDKMGIVERVMFLHDETGAADATEIREVVCAAEIWCECMQKLVSDMTNFNMRAIHSIMRTMPGWEQQPNRMTFPRYGRQQYYKRIKQD